MQCSFTTVKLVGIVTFIGPKEFMNNSESFFIHFLSISLRNSVVSSTSNYKLLNIQMTYEYERNELTHMIGQKVINEQIKTVVLLVMRDFTNVHLLSSK